MSEPHVYGEQLVRITRVVAEHDDAKEAVGYIEDGRFQAVSFVYYTPATLRTIANLIEQQETK